MQDLNHAKPPNPLLHNLDAPDTKVEPNLDTTRVSATGPIGDLDMGKTRPGHARDSFPREKYGVFRTNLSNELPPALDTWLDACPVKLPAAVRRVIRALAEGKRKP